MNELFLPTPMIFPTFESIKCIAVWPVAVNVLDKFISITVSSDVLCIHELHNAFPCLILMKFRGRT